MHIKPYRPGPYNFGKLHQGWGLLSQFPPFRYFPKIFDIVKTHVSYWTSRLYLAAAATAQLLRHLSTMTIIPKNLTGIFVRSQIILPEKLTKGTLVNSTQVYIPWCWCPSSIRCQIIINHGLQFYPFHIFCVSLMSTGRTFCNFLNALYYLC